MIWLRWSQTHWWVQIWLVNDSHGVSLVPSYAAQNRAGTLKPAARASVELAPGMLATLAVNGAMGWGPPAAFLATDKTIERAQQFGVGAAVIRQCQYIGRVGQYTERIAAQDLIGIVTCNSSSGVAPFDRKQTMLGTNPIAIAVPRQGNQAPVLFDESTSVVAGNKRCAAADERSQGIWVGCHDRTAGTAAFRCLGCVSARFCGWQRSVGHGNSA